MSHINCYSLLCMHPKKSRFALYLSEETSLSKPSCIRARRREAFVTGNDGGASLAHFWTKMLNSGKLDPTFFTIQAFGASRYIKLF